MRRNPICLFSGLLLAILILIPGVVQAVEEFKVSAYGAGVQIWFEAEAFDERIPDSNQYFRVTGENGVPDAPDGAFSKAINRSGGSGGTIIWHFNIDYTEGSGGTWLFWARVYNPDNLSDYMLVEGDPDDEIPAGPPFPGGDATPPFDNNDDRIFERSDPSWAWWGNDEGSPKELQDGENTMYIFHRQGGNTVYWDVFMWTDSSAYIPNDDDYKNAEAMKASDNISVRSLNKLSTTWGSIKL
jgi:hypothetical protein